MNIKDFILNENDEVTIKKDNTKTPTEYAFNLEYENDTDFILKRTTQRTEKLLVVLVSQGQIYIKDVKQNIIEKITNVSQISNFKRNMTILPKFEKLTWEPFIEDYRNNIRLDTEAFEVFLTHTETVKILANKKANPLKHQDLIYSYERDPEAFERQNEFLKIIHLFDPSMTSSSYDYTSICNGLKNTKIDYNMVKTNLDVIRELGVNNFKALLKSNYTPSILNIYKVEFRTFLTYLAYTIKNRNGLNIIEWDNYSAFGLNQYLDYLRTQVEMYGKVKEKYPQYWLSEKQMLNNKYNSWKKLQSLEIKTINQEDLKKYEYEDNVFKVVVPQLNVDILDEAQQQQHCLATYLDRIIAGNTHIVFIRAKLNPDDSLLTVEITPDGRIVQVRGFQNRQYTSLEYSFMKDWAKEKDLKLEVKSV